MKRLHIIFAALAAFIIAGCNPGIIEAPPAVLTDVAKYFWSDSSREVEYVRTKTNTSTTEIFSLDLSRKDELFITNRNAPSSAPLIAHFYDDRITMSGLTSESLIALPEGFSVRSNKTSTETFTRIPRFTNCIITASRTAIIADDSIGVYILINGTAQWRSSFWKSEWGAVTIFERDIFSGTTVFAGTSKGYVCSTSDNGNTWAVYQSPEFSNSPITGLAHAKDEYLYVASADGKVFRTRGNGTINMQSDILNYDTEITSLAAITIEDLPKQITHLVAGTKEKGIVVRSIHADSSTNWKKANIGASSTNITSLSALSSTHFLAIASDQLQSSSQLLASSDMGVTWKSAGQMQFFARLLSTSSAKDNGTVASDTVLYSIMRSQLKQSIVRSFSNQGRINALSSFDDNIICALDSTIAFSSDGGQTWQQMTAGLLHTVTRIKYLPGELVLLKSAEKELRIGSTWDAGELINHDASIVIPLTARIHEHLDTLALPDGSKYGDVFGVQYSYEGVVSSGPTPNIRIYYAKDTGPIYIEEYAAGKLNARAYLRKKK